MKILLRLRLCSPALGHALASDSTLARALGAKPNAAVGYLFPKFFDAAGPVLPRVLALAQAHGEALSLLRDMQFSSAEIDAASHLEVLCKVTIAQSRADADRTRAAYDADVLRPGPSRWPVRLPRTLYLSKPVPPNTLAHVDQWTGEYVCDAATAQALRSSGLNGWGLDPVLQPRVAAVPVVGEHLVSTELLPAALEDFTRVETFDDGPRAPSQPRRYGLLAYAPGALASSTDFSRTAEPWGSWRTPLWVVRQPVRQWFAAAGLRGWGFWPVLEEGSALHAAHGRHWREVLDQLQAAGASVSI